MRFGLVLAASSALALAACSGEGGEAIGGGSTAVEDPSDPTQIAAALDRLPKPQAGEYRISGELVDFEAEGASEEEQQMARGMFEMMFSQARTVCMTQEEAEQGYQEMVENLSQNSDECAYSRYVVDGNTIDATMQCDDGAGNGGTIEFDGTINETSQAISIVTDMSGEGQSLRMSLNVNLDRVGDCGGDEANG